MRAFESTFRSSMADFIELKRAMGCRYRTSEGDLRRFDRFIVTFEPEPETITCEVVDQWLRAGAHLSVRMQQSRLGIVRQFCRYLARLDPRTFVPDSRRFPVGAPKFKPHIYSPDEVRALLAASLRLPRNPWPLQPRTVHTMLLVAYSTGLRAGEIGRLRIRDIDLVARTLVVRDTKFFKSRIVPFSESLARSLRSFFETRSARQPNHPAAPFFLNLRRRALDGARLSMAFHRLVKAAGIRSRGTRGPRLHDLRHTFAVHCLLRWHRQGEDVQAKMPLLSTYMGHSSVVSTHVYLTATAELLQHASQRFERRFGDLLRAEGAYDAAQ